jgi:hypothetical protein
VMKGLHAMVLSLLAVSASCLRVPFRVYTQRIQANILSAMVPSPFAIAEAFPTSVLKSSDTLPASLTLEWDAEVCERQVNELLVALATSSSAAAELTVVSRRRAAKGFRIVVRGSRAAGRALLELAAMRNLAVATATWS